jgi:gliding motility-associated-like protein
MDNKLRNILNDKLDGYESTVPEKVWNRIEDNIPSAATPPPFGVAAKWIAGIALTATCSFGLFWLNTASNSSETLPSSEKTQVPANPPSDSTIAKGESNSAVSTNLHIVAKVSDDVFDAEVTDTGELPTMSASKPAVFPNLEMNTEQPSEKSDLKEKNLSIGKEENNHSETTSYIDFSFSVAPVNEYDLTYFFMPAKTDAETYTWDFGDGSTSADLSPLHTYDTHGTYEVSLEMTSGGETDTWVLKIECYPQPHWEAPTIFTPNGDGKNDVFDLAELSKNVVFTGVSIFNENGKRIYHSDHTASWDGILDDGARATEGYYTYQVQGRNLRQQIVEKNGRIYLKH